MKKEGFDFFQNRACEYFPCHKGVADEDFNCLFCYCPLYLLGDECGGKRKYQRYHYRYRWRLYLEQRSQRKYIGDFFCGI